MYILKDWKGNQRMFTADEIIENAKQQKKSGIKPEYRYYYGKHDGYSDPGYLVVSMYSGCIVVIEHGNGNWQIIHSWQGDFVYGLADEESLSREEVPA